MSNLQPDLNYQKLIEGNYMIIYREDDNRVYLNRIFDCRQDPRKLNL